MNFNNLSPEDQNVLAQLFAKASGNQQTPDVQQQAQAPMPDDMPPPGSFKDDPEGARKFIAEKLLSRGPRLEAGPEGSGHYIQKRKADDPIGRLFGLTTTSKIPTTNYLDAAKKAGLEEYLASDLPVTPDGRPLVTDKILDNARQLRDVASKKDSTYLNQPDPELSRAFLERLKSGGADPNVVGLLEKRFAQRPVTSNELVGLEATFGTGKYPYMFLKDPRTNEYFGIHRTTGQSFSFIDGVLKPVKKNLPEGLTTVEGGEAALLESSASASPFLREGAQQMFNSKQLDQIDEERNKFEQNAVLKRGREVLSTFPTVRGLLNSDIPAAIGPTRMNFVRTVAKEVGNLSRTEVVENSGSQAYFDQMSRWVEEKLNSGKFSDKDVQDFNDMLDIAEQKLHGYMVKEAETHVDRIRPYIKDEKRLEEARKMITRGLPSLTANPYAKKPLVSRPQHGTQGPIDKLTGKAGRGSIKPGGISTASDYMSKFKKGK